MIERILEKGTSEVGKALALFLKDQAKDPSLFAFYLLGHFLEDAHSCLDILEGTRVGNELLRTQLSSEEVLEALSSEPCVSYEKAGLFVLQHQRLFTRRFFDMEQELAEFFAAKAKSKKEAQLETALEGKQMEAVKKSLEKDLVIVTGGPGTGKTFVTKEILRALGLKAAACAPTGRAAARLAESLGVEASTIHKLLRLSLKGFPRYTKDRPLSYEVVIVDEVSMVDLSLMTMLIRALKEDAKLILLGDKDQLSSVEAGNILSDLCQSPVLKDCIVYLDKSYRFSEKSKIFQVASAVNEQDFDKFVEVIEEDADSLEVVPEKIENYLLSRMQQLKRKMETAGLEETLEEVRKIKILSPTRHGRLGTVYLNNLISREVFGKGDLYQGLPIIVEKNDYALELYNGDLGILWDDGRGLRAWFSPEKSVPLSGLVFSPAWAMTVHKSQGSEFDEVLCIVKEDLLFGKELLYTAVTRARKKVVLCGGLEDFKSVILTKTKRFSGLVQKLQ